MTIPFITEEHRILNLKYHESIKLVNDLLKTMKDSAYHGANYIESEIVLEMITKFKARLLEIDRTGR